MKVFRFNQNIFTISSSLFRQLLLIFRCFLIGHLVRWFWKHEVRCQRQKNNIGCSEHQSSCSCSERFCLIAR